MTPSTTDVLASLPLRLLCVAQREPRWTLFAVQMDAACGNGLRIHWVADVSAALTELRTNCYDALLLGIAGDVPAPGCARSVELVDAVLTLDAGAALVMLLPLPDDRLLSELYARDCDVCISPRMWDSPALPAVVLGAIRRRQQSHELQRCAVSHQRRLSREQSDAESILRLQQELLLNLQTGIKSSSDDAAVESPALAERYDELLKTAILSGANRLGRMLDEFVDDLMASDQRPADMLALHVDRVQALSAGSGGRASQLLRSRADLLALEVLARLGEGYRGVATHKVARAA